MVSIVFVNNPNGKKYAYENISYWDKTTKTTKHKRRCIGHVDPISGDIVPNRGKGDALPSKTQTCIVQGIGVSLLFDRIAEEIGLVNILKV
jgi:hypothetical protein